MTQDEAIALAKLVAARRGWQWSEPVAARRYRRWLVGAARWEVLSNSDVRGMNVRVEIDDSSRVVLAEAFLPR